MKDRDRLDVLVSEVNSPKHELIVIMNELEEAGFIQKANSLGTLIGKLEDWQHNAR